MKPNLTFVQRCRQGIAIVILCLVSGLLLTACNDDGDSSGGGSDSLEDSKPETLAFFFDSPVRGLHYISGATMEEAKEQELNNSYYGGTETENGGFVGMTSESGQFIYAPNQPTTFYFGGLIFGTLELNQSDDAGKVITPIDLLEDTDETNYQDNTTLVNMLRLLQTLNRNTGSERGIRLPDLDEAHRNVLADLDMSSPSFDDDYHTLLANAGYCPWQECDQALVTAEDALEHFELTLAGMSIEEQQLVGQWGMHDGKWGDYSARLTLNADYTGYLLEPGGDCGDDEHSFLPNLDRALAICPRREDYTITWSLEGNILTLDAGSFKDTCNIVVRGSESFRAVCRVYSGQDSDGADIYEAESAFFVRETSGLETRLLQGNSYTSFTPGYGDNESISTVTFGTDNNGAYSNAEDGTVNFTWEVAENGQSYTMTTEDEVIQMSFERYFAGLFEDSEDGDVHLMIPNIIDPVSLDIAPRNRQCYDLISGLFIESCEMNSEKIGELPQTVFFELDDYNMHACRIFNYVGASEVHLYWLACNPEWGDSFRYIMLRIAAQGGR